MHSIPERLDVIGVSGHRIQSFTADTAAWVQDMLARVLRAAAESHGASVLATGCATGTDLWAAQRGISLGYLHVPFLPFEGEAQREKWPAAWQRLHQRVLDASWTPACVGTVLPAPGDRQATRDAMMVGFDRRNQALVDASDVLVAAWNGRRYGGTASALRMALLAQKPIVLLLTRDRLIRTADHERLADHLEVTLPLAAVA